MARRTFGFTLFELLLVLCLVMILFLVVVDRLLPLRAEAEAAHVSQVVGSIRSGLGLAVAERAVEGGLETLPELDGSDPMQFLARVPPNYGGTLEGAAAPPAGEWAFHSGSGSLLYRPRWPGAVPATGPDPEILAWRILVTRPERGLPRVEFIAVQAPTVTVRVGRS